MGVSASFAWSIVSLGAAWAAVKAFVPKSHKPNSPQEAASPEAGLHDLSEEPVQASDHSRPAAGTVIGIPVSVGANDVSFQ